jgi:PEP-CTERM motif
LALAQSPLNAGVLLDANGNDATGDVFGSKDFDLLSVTVGVNDTSIRFRLKFAQKISIDFNDTNYVAGYIDLDLDRNLTTDLDGLRLPGRLSGGSNTEFLAEGSGESFLQASLGTDLFIDLFPSLTFGAGPDQVDVVDVRSGNLFVGFADLSVDASFKELSITISQSFFASPVVEGSFDFGVIVGAIPSPTSVFPFASDVAVGNQPFAGPPTVPEPSSIFVFAVAALGSWRRRTG